MLTVGTLFAKLAGLSPDTPVVIGIIEGARYTALDAMPERDFEPGKTLLYILCEQHERAVRRAETPAPAEPPPPTPPRAPPEASKGIWNDAPPPAHAITDLPAAIVPLKDACPNCQDRCSLRLAVPETGEVECLKCGHVFRLPPREQ